VSDPPDPEEFEVMLREMLLRYVTQHPQAMDTAEGISAWWTRGEVGRDVETVRRVLDRLTDEGLFERLGAGRYSHYRAARVRGSN
jgi:Fe2+ or Zn2+ uptake regulation protein